PIDRSTDRPTDRSTDRAPVGLQMVATPSPELVSPTRRRGPARPAGLRWTGTLWCVGGPARIATAVDRARALGPVFEEWRVHAAQDVEREDPPGPGHRRRPQLRGVDLDRSAAVEGGRHPRQRAGDGPELDERGPVRDLRHRGRRGPDLPQRRGGPTGPDR